MSSGHETQEYIKICRMEKVKRIMKMREIQCPEYNWINGHSVEIESSVFESMQNLEWVREASKVYERIEETKKWLS